MNITPDATVYWHVGPFSITATLVFSWVVMAVLVVGSLLITRNLSIGPSVSRGQLLLEIVLDAIRAQIRDVAGEDADRFLPFIGTLFLFIALSNVLVVVPGFHPPTGSLSTTSALALCVFMAVPIFGIMARGPRAFLKSYLQPTVFMLPFNIIGEVTRTIALSIRLFGNMLSGTMITATALAIAPLFFPMIMNALGLLIGLLQAYIFSMLALVFIASATSVHEEQAAEANHAKEHSNHG